MLCDTCYQMLHHHEGLKRNLRYELRFAHHRRLKTLCQSAESGCSICAAVAKQLERDEVDLYQDREINLQAALAVIWGRQWNCGYYSLDFLLDGKWIRTFALRPKARRWSWRRAKPAATESDSEEVFALAQRWASRCKCADSTQEWYPDRLLDLQEVRRAIASNQGISLKLRVRLVENSVEWKLAEARKSADNRYVTLSHCWGANGVGVKLVAGNREVMKTEGLALEDLPTTFRDAVIFASRLENVRYIWVDSLCIIQQSKDDVENVFEEDWRKQSAMMDKVYHKSYLNISATTSPDSNGGLFGPRNPEVLKEDEVDLRTSGMVRLAKELATSEPPTVKKRLKSGAKAIFKCLNPIKRKKNMKNCSVIDLSLWDDLVEHGAVNARGWVYQERLLAPRVLHFCKGQIAWECSERDCTERYPDGVPGIQLKCGVIVGEDRLKGLEPEKEGKTLREARLEGMADPDKDIPRIRTYELWKRLVEVFSQKKLTFPQDKLIALTGVAKHFFETQLQASMPLLHDQSPYVAGMWREHLASQLLWHVEPIFENGRIFNFAKRHAARAPSFSWAALDVPQGVVYGEFTDREVFFKVKDVEIEYVDETNHFGLLDGPDCRVLLNGRVARVDLHRLGPQSILPYGWRPSGVVRTQEPTFRDLYTDVYLDCPDSDEDIFEPGARIFCMPAVRGDRTDRKADRHLKCLLMQLTGESGGTQTYKRVGIAMLSLYEEGIFEKEIEGAEYQDFYLY